MCAPVSACAGSILPHYSLGLGQRTNARSATEYAKQRRRVRAELFGFDQAERECRSAVRSETSLAARIPLIID
jgi:hypothetical protein